MNCFYSALFYFCSLKVLVFIPQLSSLWESIFILYFDIKNILKYELNIYFLDYITIIQLQLNLIKLILDAIGRTL